MSVTVRILIGSAVVAANLPWLSDRILFVFAIPNKPFWVRLLEWLLLYFVVGLLALGLETKVMGEVHTQDWEFYTVTLFLFGIYVARIYLPFRIQAAFSRSITARSA